MPFKKVDNSGIHSTRTGGRKVGRELEHCVSVTLV